MNINSDIYTRSVGTNNFPYFLLITDDPINGYIVRLCDDFKTLGI